MFSCPARRTNCACEPTWKFIGIRIEWAQGLPDAQLKVTRLDPSLADLHYRGYSVVHQANASSPELPDYNRIAASKQIWRDLEGYYTRYGDVRELLAGIDDRYVIMNAGDEITLRFPEQPPPPAGWVRDYVIAGDGWIKDGDYNSTYSRTVQPLPYHAKSEYNQATGQAGRRVGISPPSRRLAELPHPLRNPGSGRPGTQERCNAMKPASPRELSWPFCLSGCWPPRSPSSRYPRGEKQAQAKLDESQALARYGFHLQEVSQQAGVDFVHQAPTLDAKLDGIMPEVASMGASVSIVDFDRDGWPDIYVDQQRRPAARMPSTATCTTAHSRMLPRRWGWPMSTSQAPASPWERSGAIMTMTVTKIYF